MLGHIADPFHVVGGEHREHAGHGTRRRRIDRTHIGKGMGRSQEIRVCLPRQRRIGGEPSETAHQRIVFETPCLVRTSCCGRGFHVRFQIASEDSRDVRFITEMAGQGSGFGCAALS